MELKPLTVQDCIQRMGMAHDNEGKRYWHNQLQHILEFERNSKLYQELTKLTNSLSKAKRSPQPDWYYITQTQTHIKAIENILHLKSSQYFNPPIGE